MVLHPVASVRCTGRLAGLLLCLLASSHASRTGISSALRDKSDAEAVLFPRPSYEDHALMARWLVHENSWGVLSTLDKDSGEPVGGVVSHSDGLRDVASGRLFFYITPMDELTQNVKAHPRCSFTISEEQRRSVGNGSGGPCGGLDPEDPACARATLLGSLAPVPEAQRDTAQAAMFSRHPQMADWPAGHGFEFYELHVAEVHLLDWYGGMAVIDGDDYYAAQAV